MAGKKEDFPDTDSLILRGRQQSKVRFPSHEELSLGSLNRRLFIVALILLTLLAQLRFIEYAANYEHVTSSYQSFVKSGCMISSAGGIVPCAQDFARRGIEFANVDRRISETYQFFALKPLAEGTSFLNITTLLIIIPLLILLFLMFRLRKDKELLWGGMRYVFSISAIVLFSISIVLLLGGLIALGTVYKTYDLSGFGALFITWIKTLWPFLAQLLVAALFFGISILARKIQAKSGAATNMSINPAKVAVSVQLEGKQAAAAQQKDEAQRP